MLIEEKFGRVERLDALNATLPRVIERPFEIIRPANHEDLELHPQRSGAGLQDLQDITPIGNLRGLHEYGHARQLRDRFFEKREPLPPDFGIRGGQAGDVPSRSRKALSPALTYGVRAAHDDDRNAARRLHGGFQYHRSSGKYHVDLEPDELGRETRQPIRLGLRISPLDNDIASFHVAEIAQAFPESAVRIQPRCPDGRVTERQYADPRKLRRLLRLRGERHKREAECEN